MRRLLVLAAMLAALALPVNASAFHHVFLPGGACGESENSGGFNPTAVAALIEHNSAQTLPLPPTGTPAAEHSAEITNPPDTVACPAPQK